MTFTIHWVAIPFLVVLLAVILAGFCDRSSGNVNPWIGGGIIGCGLLMAIAFVAGHLA
jgi:hypothetical protein